MPTKPDLYNPPVDKRATCIGLLNYVRNNMDREYQAGVPLANQTNESLRQIGTAIMGFQPRFNAFCGYLVNFISDVRLRSKMYENQLAWGRQGELDLGETIEEIYVGLVRNMTYNPDADQHKVFKRYHSEGASAFHTVNYQHYYPITINRDQLRSAFISWSKFEQFIDDLLKAVYRSVNYDEFILYKYLIQTAVINHKLYVESVPVLTAETANTITSIVKGVSNSMPFMSAKYNMAGVPNISNKEDQYLIMTADYSAKIDVESLARAYNLDYVQFSGRNILVDSFMPNALELSRLNEIYAEDPTYIPFTDEELELLKSVKMVIMDKEWFMIFDKLRETQSIFNPVTLDYNYFHHVWQIQSASPFANCVVFAEGAHEVTAITISPNAPQVVRGRAGTQLTATVTGEGLYSQSVLWSIEGNTSKDTYINSAGLLVAGKNEEATTITVKATSTVDPLKFATVTATVVEAAKAKKAPCPTGGVTK